MGALIEWLDRLADMLVSAGTAIDGLVAMISKVIALCAMLAAVVPRPSNCNPCLWVYQLINLMGFNIGHARNSAEPPACGPNDPKGQGHG